MRFRYEAKKIVTVNRDDVSTSLVERVLRALVFEGSPYVIPFDPLQWADSGSFTLTGADGKIVLRMEWDAPENAHHEEIPEDERKQVDELLQLIKVEGTWFVNIPLTDEDMMKHLEIKFDKFLLASPGKLPPWVRPDAVQEAHARQTIAESAGVPAKETP